MQTPSPHREPHDGREDGGRAPVYLRERNLPLRRVFEVFVRETTARILMATLAALWGLRLWLGSFSAWDLFPIALLFVLHPVAEWLIHVFILHHRPRKILGFNFDFPAAYAHRVHHEDPWDLHWVVMPLSALFVGGVIGAFAAWWLMPTLEVAVTAMCTATLIALVYEWTHFLTHTSYRPRGRIYKRIYKFHRLHHFKNERYWMGVTRHFGDVLLGTMKEASEVETSPTARNLLGEER